MMFEELAEFVRNKRKTGMSHGYQPLLIKTLVATGGTARCAKSRGPFDGGLVPNIVL